ncbi:hypothetical protein C6495_10580 [Candidatus Poribacteria bacterium]|nr:MAG: hypothetical protein C6495_10580 [Candidatus Poribacteria bacterium]
MGFSQKGVSVGRAKIVSYTVGRGKPVPRHTSIVPTKIPRHASLPDPSIPKPIGPGAIVFNSPPVKSLFKFNDARWRAEAAVQGFGLLLIAPNKRVCQIGEPAKNPNEGEFFSIFRGKKCFRLWWYASPKEGDDEEETNCFFRFHG